MAYTYNPVLGRQQERDQSSRATFGHWVIYSLFSTPKWTKQAQSSFSKQTQISQGNIPAKSHCMVKYHKAFLNILFLSPKFRTVCYFYHFQNQTHIEKMPSGWELGSLHRLRCLVAVLKYFHQKQLFQGTQKRSRSLSKIKNLVKPFLCGINSSLSKASCLRKQHKGAKINGLLPFHTKWRASYNFSSH